MSDTPSTATVVNSHVIENYIWILTNGLAASDPDPMSDLGYFDGEIELMRTRARADGNEALLKMSMESLITGPYGRARQFNGQVYNFRDADMVELLTHAYELLWPDVPLSFPGEGPEIAFVPMSDAEWAARQMRS